MVRAVSTTDLHGSRHDPDMLVGFEVQRASWGLLVDRGKAIGKDLLTSLSRLPFAEERPWSEEEGLQHGSDIHVAGIGEEVYARLARQKTFG